MIGAGLAGLGTILFRHFSGRAKLDLHGKVVLITGGSRGLGLATAREFGSYGATIAICSTTAAELSRAVDDLERLGIRAAGFICDVGDREAVSSLVDRVKETFGSIDVLVNNAGVIRVGPAAAMVEDDFEQAMRVMFWGAFYCSMAVLPEMRARRAGSIVNITSIGGKISIPHLLPYSCAKFAVEALSTGLRTELATEGIRVTTIAPGLMRTGSHLNATFKGNHAEEYAWFAAGAATPVLSISAQRAARSIVRATMRGDAEKVLSAPADLAARVHGLAPELSAVVLNLVNKFLLPSGMDRPSTQIRKGVELENETNSKAWKLATELGRRAALDLNEA